ncbi:MAG: hypothetical protein ABID84_03425 [Chloroflexota bacterium]
MKEMVDMVLTAPVDQDRQSQDDEQYIIILYLEDGTAVRRGFRVESGELSMGIMTRAFFNVPILRLHAPIAPLADVRLRPLGNRNRRSKAFAA